ncbi:proteoglycan 4-like [Portunus trituberculatus]|uniref:proteoglycan 4-like n=1 Tax=Portunus trituberculatus TaxID=210409 RepID=UPI001E1CE4B6|nr:proteoglycan 4-like [Portunus trituberculatus]
MAGLDPSPPRSVHSMTAEETWTLLGYPFSRPLATFVTRQHSTMEHGRPRHTEGPRQIRQQTLRPVGPHPYSPMPPTRPHASRPGFPSRPWTPKPPSHPRVPINHPLPRPLPRPPQRSLQRPPQRPPPRPLSRPPFSDIKPMSAPRQPGTYTPDPLSVHNVAGPPYVNTPPTYILGRSDATTTTTALPSTTNKVWVSSFDAWQPKTSTSPSINSRPSPTLPPGQDEDPWGPFENPEWLNKWDHRWDQHWPSDWSTKKDSRPTDAKDSSSSSPDSFPAKDTNTQDAGEDYENYVPEETLMEILLKNHRLPDETTPHATHDPRHTTTQRQHYDDGGSNSVPRATTTPQTVSVSRYSEIPLTKPKPHKDAGSFPGKHKHRYPPRPFVRHREGPQDIKPLPPRGWERPPGMQTPPGGIQRKTHKLTEWSVPWRPNFAAMVPVATRRRIRRAICLH